MAKNQTPGEGQRMAIAWATAKEPNILLSDEPTGNLRLRAGQQILGLLQKLTSEQGKTYVLLTRSRAICARSARAPFAVSPAR